MDILILFLMVIGFMLIGVPIAVSLGLSSILFLLTFSDGSGVRPASANSSTPRPTWAAVTFICSASSSETMLQTNSPVSSALRQECFIGSSGRPLDENMTMCGL